MSFEMKAQGSPKQGSQRVNAQAPNSGPSGSSTTVAPVANSAST